MKRALVFMLLAGWMLFGHSSEAFAKKGFYLGVGLPYNTIGGDFDGNSGLQAGNEIIILPEIDGGLGLDIMVGYGFNHNWAIELNFLGSGHDGTWMGMTGDVAFFSFSVNGKYNLSTSGPVQPYILFGLSGNGIGIKDGSQDLATLETGDATLSGAGFNLGGGVEQYFKKMSLRFGVIYRFVEYDEAEGVHGSGTIEDTLDGSGFTVMLSTAYHF